MANGNTYATITELVNHHSENRDGLLVVLGKPILRRLKSNQLSKISLTGSDIAELAKPTEVTSPESKATKMDIIQIRKAGWLSKLSGEHSGFKRMFSTFILMNC